MTLQTGSDKTAIRSFHCDPVREAELTDPRRRIHATNTARTGNRYGYKRKACSWRRFKNSRAIGREYDWRACEERLNALPQFITEIDGAGYPFHPRPFKT